MLGTRVIVCGVLLSAVVSAAPALACRAVHRHHLSRDRGTPALVVSRTGGLFPPATVTVYADGRVVATGGARLQNPGLQLPTVALAGLITLAEAEGFFRLPPTLHCSTRATDVRMLAVAIHTREQSHTVSAPAVCPATSFRQLYDVIIAATGSVATP